MQSTFVPSDAVRRVRGRVGHPIVDGDGHLIECTPAVSDIVRDVADASVAARWQDFSSGMFARGEIGRRAGFLPVREGFFGLPAENTLDRLTAMLPDLLYRRLDEIGIDFSLLYPTLGLMVLTLPDDELRQSVARALNVYFAEVFAGYRDRLEPVAVIPTFTPEEAIAELDYAVGTLGLKAIVMSGVIPRTHRPDGSSALWTDSLAHESLYDYDPVWERCQALGVAPAFHGLGSGWGSRVSTRNYVHNHLGMFASAQEAVCRALFTGGVAMRFPGLRFAFLEGGIAWACQLFSDILGHYEKRNKEAIRTYDPARLDTEQCRMLLERFAHGRLARASGEIEQVLRAAKESPSLPDDRIDDFAESGVTSRADIIELFSSRFYFGCEADDPMNAFAFDDEVLPEGGRMNAMFASDIGHWDVPDMRAVLPEAWELVEAGHLSAEDFRAFTFDNVARMLTDANPAFFDDTVVAGTMHP